MLRKTITTKQPAIKVTIRCVRKRKTPKYRYVDCKNLPQKPKIIKLTAAKQN